MSSLKKQQQQEKIVVIDRIDSTDDDDDKDDDELLGVKTRTWKPRAVEKCDQTAPAKQPSS